MAGWPPQDCDWSQYDPYQYPPNGTYYQEQKKPMQPCVTPQAQSYVPPSSQDLTLLHSSQDLLPPPQPPPPPPPVQYSTFAVPQRVDNPRELRNKAEKQRRDKLNQSIAELASMVPPVVGARRKMHKTGVLRLTAHYLRAHQYVFGDSIGRSTQEFTSSSAQALLSLFNGFLLTTTYRGLVVVVSQNVHQYLGYTELDLLGQSIFNITHEDDRQILKDQLMPKTQTLGPNGELLVPDEPDAKRIVEESLAKEKRRFVVRFKKLGQRSQPPQYVTCHVEGSLRKSDRACRGYNRCCQIVRRARARGDNPCASGNDIVFIGVVRPSSETFRSESNLEAFRMEYRTRHSVDGEIIQCEQRIALVTGYMMHEVNGVNAMNFMHRDDVRWVIIALREMYDQHRLYGESCYRLMTKTGQFVFMRTRGRLEVDQATRAVTSFVCTNTVVEEDEGKHLIRLMKKKFALMVNNNEDVPEDDTIDVSDSESVPVEDPRQLEKVILHLVTNLPSPQVDDDSRNPSPDRDSNFRLAIIPPKKERIVSAIEKIYNVIKSFQKEPEHATVKEIHAKADVAGQSHNTLSSNSGNCSQSTVINQMTPVQNTIVPQNIFNITQEPNVAVFDKADQLDNGQTSARTTYGTEYFASSSVAPRYSPIINDAIQPNGSGVIANNAETKIKYHVYIAPHANVNEMNVQTGTYPQLAIDGTSTSSGIKRPNNFEVGDVANKKKILDAVKESEPMSGHNTLTLENFFDDAMINSQIESAISSLEHTIDPTFPDLLISTDVQDLLGDIENDEQRPG